MLEIVANYLWMVVIGSSLVACAFAATVVLVTRMMD
jgi:hypothetical protein